MSENLEVRRIRREEWQRLRTIRLDGLSDSPAAFILTAQEARGFPNSYWEERAMKGAVGGNQATMLVIDGEVTLGMAIGLMRPHISKTVAPIVSVYVSAAVRGRGLGRLLMDAVEDWASRNGAINTSLWVVETNESARRFYESRGYQTTPDRQLITKPPIRWEVRLAKDLTVAE
ncbi:MAG: GNAT family N-acetyltransferase [Actinomycetia bacterium]|nr:GNAT family N-acetyltransferase [Actinomycetes bacterium]